MKKERLPFDLGGTGRTYIVRVLPTEQPTADLTRPHEPDEGIWLFYGAMDGRTVVPYAEVWDYCEAYSETPAMVMVMWGLWHPQTPFALGIKFGPGYSSMVVSWRGDLYTRDRHGILTPTGLEGFHAPTPEQWWSAMRQVIAENAERERAGGDDR